MVTMDTLYVYGMRVVVRGQLVGVGLFHHVGSRDGTEAISLGRKYLSLLSHLLGPYFGCFSG